MLVAVGSHLIALAPVLVAVALVVLLALAPGRQLVVALPAGALLVVVAAVPVPVVMLLAEARDRLLGVDLLAEELDDLVVVLLPVEALDRLLVLPAEALGVLLVAVAVVPVPVVMLLVGARDRLLGADLLAVALDHLVVEALDSLLAAVLPAEPPGRLPVAEVSLVGVLVVVLLAGALNKKLVVDLFAGVLDTLLGATLKALDSVLHWLVAPGAEMYLCGLGFQQSYTWRFVVEVAVVVVVVVEAEVVDGTIPYSLDGAWTCGWHQQSRPSSQLPYLV